MRRGLATEQASGAAVSEPPVISLPPIRVNQSGPGAAATARGPAKEAKLRCRKSVTRQQPRTTCATTGHHGPAPRQRRPAAMVGRGVDPRPEESLGHDRRHRPASRGRSDPPHRGRSDLSDTSGTPLRQYRGVADPRWDRAAPARMCGACSVASPPSHERSSPKCLNSTIYT